MSLIKVKEYLKKYNKDGEIVEFDASSATVEEAANAIGCAEADIAKTLSFIVNGEPILIVMAGDKRCDNHKYKEFFHEKAHMIPREDLHESVYPACGSTNSAIKLSIDELENIVQFDSWIDVTK